MNRPELIAALRGINERLTELSHLPDGAFASHIDPILADLEALTHPRNEQPNAEDLRPLYERVKAECVPCERVNVVAEIQTNGESTFWISSNAGKENEFAGTGSTWGDSADDAFTKWKANHTRPLTNAEQAAKLRAQANALEGGQS